MINCIVLIIRLEKIWQQEERKIVFTFGCNTIIKLIKKIHYSHKKTYEMFYVF